MRLNSDGIADVVFEPAGRKIRSKSNILLEMAREAGITLRSDCGGRGVCGKCRVVVVRQRGRVSEHSSPERRHLTEREIDDGFRLACQLRIFSGSITVYIPDESRMDVRKIDESEVVERQTELLPAVRKIHLRPHPPSLSDPAPDFERLCRYIGDVEVSLNLLRTIPEMLRESNWDVTAVIWNNRLINLEKGDTTSVLFGIAVDIGSSKIIVHLVDLVSGKTVASGSAENPQVAYGEDIVSRVTYASKSEDNLRKLQKLVTDTVNRIVDELCAEAGISRKSIYEAVIVGNSVMHHIFFGINPKPISVSPFTPAVKRNIAFPAGEVGLRMNEHGGVFSLPLIAGFIGSDAVSNLLNVQLHRSEGVCMVVDIGTNTEIMLGNRDRIVTCSAPSGPAFEGAHIAHGMKAVSGAIEKVKIHGCEVTFKTVDDLKPRGICGSGMIDLIAELYKNGIINQRGRFVKEMDRIVSEKNRLKFMVALPDETENQKPIFITERDINEFLMAKGAIRAGWKILTEHFGIEPSEISRIFIAGSFGRHINVENARMIGLIPDIPSDRIEFIGDSAVSGAKIALKSVKERMEAEKAVKNIEYVELSAEKDFYQIYVRSIGI